MGNFRMRELLLMGVWLVMPTEARGNIFERATCPDPTYTQCSNTKLPADFCCPAGATCIELAASTTLLCCPANSNCTKIQPLTCDIQKQNTTAFPQNILKTTALDVPLAKCGIGCCPFGFTCSQDASTCDINPTQDASPTSTSNSTVSVIPVDSSSTPNASCAKFPVSAVLAGFFPGLVLGVLLTIASVCALGAHRRSSSRRRSESSFGNISEPQPMAATDMRTDFLRKPPTTPSTGMSTRSKSVQRVRSLFRKSHNTTSTVAEPVPLAGGPQRTQPPPVTPRLQREPSYENINIFADSTTAKSLRQATPPPGRMSGQTTFTDMMESSGLAGLQKGQR
jgi:hypothetical protein